MDALIRVIRALPFFGRLEPRLMHFVGTGSLSEDDALAGLLRFAAMGLVSTLTYFVAAMLFFRYDMAPTTASILAMLIGLAVSFVVQSRVTFRRTGFHLQDAVRFGALGTAGLLLAHYSVVVVHDEFGKPEWYAAAFVSLAVPVVNFAAMNFWVFKHR